jgi:hypothetical protein
MRQGGLVVGPPARVSIVGIACAAALLAFCANAWGQTITVVPADGSGTATVTGTDANGAEYTATLYTTFSPTFVDPGEPFTFTARLEEVTPNGDPDPCAPGTTTQTTDYDSLGFWQVTPGQTSLTTDFYPSRPVLATAYSNTETTSDICPQTTFTSGPISATVSGSETLKLQDGCYQSTVPEAGLYMPYGGNASEPQVHSISGTVATLSVGNTLPCAKLSPDVFSNSETITFAKDATATLPLDCQSSQDCEGRVVIDAKPKQHGRVLYPGCKHCTKVASASYSIPAAATGKVALKLNKAGIRILFRGTCKHCQKQRAEKGQVLYPRCSKCKVPGLVVIKDSRNGAKSTTPIVLKRGGRCKNCT